MNASLPDSLEKAAILIASLDADSADALLERIEPELAARIRNAVMQLPEVDPEQQQHVIQEFVNRNPANVVDTDDGVQLDLSLADKLATEPVQAPERIAAAEKAAAPFASLRDVPASVLSELLIREHPQTIAIVAAHLASAQAAEVLGYMPEHLQTEVLMRIARLDTPPPEVIEDLESEMSSLLANRRREPRATAAGIRAVAAILESSNDNQRRSWVTRLAAHDETLSQALGSSTAATASSPARFAAAEDATPLTARSGAPRFGVSEAQAAAPATAASPISFADFEKLSDTVIAQVLATADPKVTMIALAGASRSLVQRIMNYLEPDHAARLDREMQQIGPIRLDDIERAQDYLAQLASTISASQAAPATPKHRFVVAA